MPPSEEFRRLYRHGALVIWPPEDLRATVGALRQRYDPASQAICDAHITLSQPFLKEPDDEALALIAALVREHMPLELEYGPLASFVPYPCVYLEVRPSEPLRSLQRALYALDLFDLSLPYSDPDIFVFHMSITDGYPDAEQTQLTFDALSGSEPVGRFQANSVAWIRPDAEMRFSTARTFESGQA